MSVDPDFLTSGVTGAPETWGDECCEVVLASGVASSASATLTPEPTSFFRHEVIIGAEGLSDNDERMAFWFSSQASGIDLVRAFVRQIAGGELRWRFRVNEAGASSNIYTGTSALTLATMYRMECKWDTATGSWEIRQNGSTLFGGGLSSISATAEPDQIGVGGWDTNPGTATWYLDNVAQATDDWIGGEPGAPSAYRITDFSPALYAGIVSM